MAAPALTSLSHGAGCGCKLSAADLRPIVAGLPAPSDPRVLVAADTADDAGVVKLTDELALVQTADFFTPIVDDPYAFGRIAATNALSDIYAMGGEPVSALNLVAYPLEPRSAARCCAEILRGGADAVAAAGRLDRRRALDRRPRAQVRARRHRHRAPRPGAHERRRPRGRRARAHQAARRRRRRDGDQARPRRRRAGGARDRGHDHAQRRCRRRRRAPPAPTR